MPLAPRVKPLLPEQIDEYEDAMRIHDFDLLPTWIQSYLSEVQLYAFIATYPLDVEKHLAGQHDQKTHGKGGVHGRISRRELWATDMSASNLKSQVAADISKRMIDSGVPIDSITAMQLKTYEEGGSYVPLGKEDFTLEQLQQKKWEGAIPASQIVVYEVDANPTFSTKVGRVEAMGVRIAADKNQMLTYEEAQQLLAERNAKFPDKPAAMLYEDAKGIMAEDAVSKMIGHWASSSNDDMPESLAIQETAKRMFKLDDSSGWTSTNPDVPAATQNLLDRHSEVYEGFLQAQYDNTQEFFKAKGVTEITVFRGLNKLPEELDIKIKGDIREGYELQSRPLSSWTSRLETAADFATQFSTNSGGTIFRQVIPVSRIIATPFTGVGSKKEEEFVILGGIDKTDVAEADGSWDGEMFEDYQDAEDD